jgi:fibronectin-binding autotransporter adhesin
MKPLPNPASKLKAHLLCCTALSLFAAPALADTVTAVGTIANWQDNAGHTTTTPGAGLLSDDGTTVTVSLQGSRTILDWKSTGPLNIASGKALSFEFLGRPDIVLNRVTAGSATINGTLTGTVAGTPGGNIWIAAHDGVLFGNGAIVSTGGLLATTSPMTTSDANFLAGRETVSGANHIFTFGDAVNSVSIGDAHITVNGGVLAFVAPVVTSAANTAGNGVDGTGSVLYGAANAFKITLAPDGATNWDLVSFEVPAGKGSSAAGSIIALAGQTNVTGSVYLAAVNSTVPTQIITVSGPIATSAAVDDNGNIVLSAGHDIVGNAAVTASNGGKVAVNVTGSGGLDAAGDITVKSQGDISADQHIFAPAGAVTLISNGAIAAGTADIHATTLTGSSAGAANLSSAGNAIGTLSGFTNTSGSLSIADSTQLTVTGTVDATGQTLTFNNSGAGIDAAGAVIKASMLTGSAAGAADFSNASNRIGNLGSFSNTAGSTSIKDILPLTVTGTVDATGQTLNLIDTSGGIDASAAPIKAGTLTGSTTGTANFSNSGNLIAALGTLTNISGPVSLRDSVPLTVTGTLNATGQSLTLTNTGGGIDASAAAIKAATLTGTTAGTTSLSNAGNIIGTLNGFTDVSGSLAITNSLPFTISGTIDATGQTLTFQSTSGGIAAAGAVIKAGTLAGSSTGTGDFTNPSNEIGNLANLSNVAGPLSIRDSVPLLVNGPVDATGQTLTLNNTGGGIVGSGLVKAATLTGSSTGAVNLSNSNNLIATLNNFSNISGPLSITVGTPLTVTGTIDATGQTLSLSNTGGGIDAAGAVIKAATLAGSSTATADFTNAANAIGNLGNFTNTAGPTSITDAMPLSVTDTVDGSGQTLTIIDTGGGITAAGIVKAGTLSGSSTGAANFSNSNNRISTLNTFTNTLGALSVADAVPLTVTGTVDATGQTLTLINSGGGIAAGGAVIKAATLAGSSIAAADFTNAANAIGNLGNFTNTAGPLSITDAAPLSISGSVDATSQTLTLTDTGGGIAAAGAIIKTAKLTGTSAGSADFSNAANSIAVLGDFTNIFGPLSVRDAIPLTVSGTVSTPGQVLTLNDPSGAITASGGIIKAGTLAGASGGEADFTNPANAIGTLSNFSNSSGPLNVTDSVPLTITGTVNVGGQTLTLNDTGGGIEAAGGVIKAKLLTGSTKGATDFANAGNAVDTLGDFALTTGNFTLNNSQTLDVQGYVRTGALDKTGGPAAGSGNITLKTTSGNLTVTGADNSGGKLQANDVSLTAAGNILMGSGDNGDGQGFIPLFRNLQDPAAVDLLIDSLEPARTANVFILANSVKVESPGTILQQNTGTRTVPDGIRIFHFGSSTAISITGRPLVVNMFGTLVIDGVPLAASAIASAASVRLFPPILNNHYRVDNCIIGQAGSCTNIQFNISAIQPVGLAGLLTVRGADNNNQNDPTITGAGNDELEGQP